MATNQTYGVTSTEVGAYLAQLGLGSATHKIDPDDMVQMIAGAAAEFNGVLLAAGLQPSDVAADSTSVAYAYAQRAVCYLTIPDVLISMFDSEAADKASKTTRERAERMLRAIQKTPAILGLEAGNPSPRVSTTVEALALDTTTTGRRRRWRWRRDDDHNRAEEETW